MYLGPGNICGHVGYTIDVIGRLDEVVPGRIDADSSMFGCQSCLCVLFNRCRSAPEPGPAGLGNRNANFILFSYHIS
jgi:hypothetical protein